MIDVFTSQPHYIAHLAGIWAALPAESRGRFYVAGRVADQPNVWGVDGWRIGYPTPGPTPTLVAGYCDEVSLGRPVIYLEHGAGQTYPGDPRAADHPAYNGTPGHERVALFLCPNDTVACRWRRRYPQTPAVAVGSPKMDAWHKDPGAGRRGAQTPTAAIAFHSDNRICPETVTAFRHYESGLAAAVAELRAAGWGIVGHGHPRLWATMDPFWRSIGVEPVEDFGEVLARAHILAADNTSVLPEFASTGRPVVWMNAPWYRRNVHHGGRFWEWPAGQVTVDAPEELAAAIVDGHSDTDAARAARAAMVEAVYMAADGMATRRAVAAIAQYAPGPPPGPYAGRQR
ncbi:MAG: CDP-glycerol glycerophosphotransferase family protein [Acidimicrobiales bacterium]